MKDFCKWLGVNEKIAKIVVWIFIFFVSLIIINTAFESLGLSYYKITVDNLSQLNGTKIINYVSSWLIALMNFYSIVFLIFRIKDFKKVFKWSILYLILNILFYKIGNYALLQIYIIIFVLGFCYFFSNKNWKYLLYAISSIVLNIFVQYICYLYKARFIDYNNLNTLTRLLLGFDFFIIIGIIILIKEIVLKKRNERREK